MGKTKGLIGRTGGQIYQLRISYASGAKVKIKYLFKSA